ncbi:MAG: GC-type dockerin domain-anchored protein [Phycisphaerales bacterium]|jgi:hypothetical protein
MRANTKTIGTLVAAAGGLALPGLGAGVALAQDCGWESIDASVRPYAEWRRQLVVYDDGSGPALYVSAGTLRAGGEYFGSIGRFDGNSWSAVGDLGEAWISALDTLDLGDGTRLYAAVSDSSSSTIHVLDGDTWVPFGPELDGVARWLVAFDDGSGPMLYAAGDISTSIDDQRVNGVARLEDGAWAGFGATGRFDGVLGLVHDLEVFDDGNGPALYLAGDGIRPDDPTVERGMIRWDGDSFSTVEGSPPYVVRDMLVFDDGDGEALYVGGRLGFPGSYDAGVARWDGSTWTVLGEGFEQDVLSLTSFDRGDRPALYAAGWFEEIGGQPIEGIARWDGVAWRPFEESVGGSVVVIEGWDDGDLRGLYAVGGSEFIGGEFVGLLPRWPGCLTCRADLDSDGELTIFDFLAFTNLFDAGLPSADFDGDGELTIFDFLAFQDEFDAGC